MFDGRDTVQQHVEEYCATRVGREIYFERRLNQYGHRKVKSDVINRRHMIQSYGAMWLGVPQKTFAYRSLASGAHGALFAQDHDALLYHLAGSAYINLSRLTGAGRPIVPQYRPAIFHLIYGLKLMVFGAGQMTLRGEALEKAGESVLSVIWDADRLRSVLGALLLPAVDEALVGQSLSELGAATRDDQFTERFRRAVLDRTLVDRQRVQRAA
jgi:hypothetical protein